MPPRCRTRCSNSREHGWPSTALAGHGQPVEDRSARRIRAETKFDPTMTDLSTWSQIAAILAGVVALTVLVEKAWKPIRRLIQWMKAINNSAPALQTVTIPKPPKVVTPPTRRRRQSHYETICEVDNARKWNGRIPPLYPDAVATGPYAQRQLANYRNGTRTR